MPEKSVKGQKRPTNAQTTYGIAAIIAHCTIFKLSIIVIIWPVAFEFWASFDAPKADLRMLKEIRKVSGHWLLVCRQPKETGLNKSAQTVKIKMNDLQAC